MRLDTHSRFANLVARSERSCGRHRNILNGWLSSLGAFAGGSPLTRRWKTHHAFFAKSWCSERGTTSVLSSIITGKTHSAMLYNPPRPAFSTTVRGTIGTPGCTFCPFHPCPSALSPREEFSCFHVAESGLTSRDCAIMYGRMRRSKERRVQTVSFVKLRKLKAQDRRRDWRRLARGEVTPEQLQAENAAVRNTHEFRILNSAEAARFFRRQRLHNR